MSVMVSLDAFDLLEAALVAERIAVIRSVLKSTKEFVDGVSSFERHYIGALGEVAVCKHFGVRHPRAVVSGGDNGVDLVINGWKAQIKCRTYLGKDPEIIFKTLDYFKADVCIATKLESATKIAIVGCISRTRFRKIAEQKNYGYGDHWCVPETALDDVCVITENRRQEQAIQQEITA